MENKGLVLPGSSLNAEDITLIGINSLCRLCGGQSERLIGIFSNEGVTNDLVNKINLYLPIKICMDDVLPVNCCWNCASTVLAWHELVVTTAETDRKLRESHIITGKPISEDVLYPGTSPVHNHKRIEESVPTMPTLNDFEPEPDDKILPKLEKREKTESASVHPDNSSALESYINDFIDPELVDNPDYKMDMETTAALPENSELKNDEDGDNYFACPYCQAVFVLRDDILAHIQNEHEKELDISVTPVSKQEVTEAIIKKEKRKNNKIDPDVISAAKVVVDGRIYYNCKECGKSLHSPYTYIWHMRIHTGERPYVCDLCGKQFRVSQGLVRHLRETHEGIKKFPCDICGRMFATRRNVEEHRRIHTNERPYVCDLCGKSFKQKASLFVHKRSHKNYFPFKCSYCNHRFRTKPPLMVHITRHTGEKPYTCDICGRCFRIKYELKRHRLIHSDEKPWVCNICGFRFRQKRYLRNHTKSNHSLVADPSPSEAPEPSPTLNPDPLPKTTRQRRRNAEIKANFFCDICKKGFTRKHDVRRHEVKKHNFKEAPRVKTTSNTEILRKAKQRTESGELFYSCDFCAKTFAQSYNLMRHRTIHTGVKSYVCDSCGKSFRMSSGLKTHIDACHSNVKKFSCDVCNKMFTARITLEQHMNIHTDTRPFVCDICGKAFRQSASLYIHKLFHSSTSRFQCKTCNKPFKRAYELKLHTWKHTGYRPYKCLTCDASFRLNCDLRRHSRSHQRIKEFTCSDCGSVFKQEGHLRMHQKIHKTRQDEEPNS